MKDSVAAGEVEVSDKFVAGSRNIKTERFKERIKVRAKMEAQEIKRAKLMTDPNVAANRESPGRPSARRN